MEIHSDDFGSIAELHALVDRLRGSRDWRDEIAWVSRLVADEPARALAAADVLDADLATRRPDLAVASVRASLLDIVVTLPNPDATRIAAALGAQAVPRRTSVRALAAMQIAGTRPAREINGLLQTAPALREQDPEFGLLLVHELVIRGAATPYAADHYVAWAESTSHPLRHLPLRLMPMETGLWYWLPRYRQPPHATGVAVASSATSAQHPPTRRSSPVPLGSLCRGVGSVIEVDEAMIASAVDQWVEHSNGQRTIRGWQPGVDFSAEQGTPAPRLHDDVPSHQVTAAESCGMLFSAAVGGGAYTRGYGGPHSRLRMWQTICGMFGAPWPTPIDDLATRASAASWIQLDPVDEWFHNIAWDVWLLMMTDTRVVVVAATDTD